jgi:hypothetical protein
MKGGEEMDLSTWSRAEKVQTIDLECCVIILSLATGLEHSWKESWSKQSAGPCLPAATLDRKWARDPEQFHVSQEEL